MKNGGNCGFKMIYSIEEKPTASSGALVKCAPIMDYRRELIILRNMMTTRGSNEILHSNHGGLDSRLMFSFANYYAPEQMSFRSLRVINEERIAVSGGCLLRFA